MYMLDSTNKVEAMADGEMADGVFFLNIQCQLSYGELMTAAKYIPGQMNSVHRN